MQKSQTSRGRPSSSEAGLRADLRALVLHYAKRRGWRTQRRIATACELEETALSRFLNGEQDLGARRTHALFRAVGIPVDDYDLAYELLARIQEQARLYRDARLRHRAQAPVGEAATLETKGEVTAIARVGSLLTPEGPTPSSVVTVRYLPPDEDLPMSDVLVLFQRERYTSAQIAAFFGG